MGKSNKVLGAVAGLVVLFQLALASLVIWGIVELILFLSRN